MQTTPFLLADTRFLTGPSWQRFWCKRGDDFHAGDDGFLIDPEGKFSKRYGSSARPFAAIAESPCLALLGEQGIGKSTATHDAFLLQQRENSDPSVAYQFLDLGAYGDEGRLIADSFQSAAMCKWKEGDGTYVLFLDSFDECQIQIPKLAALLVCELKLLGSRLGQFQLRVVCRTGAWPAYLDRELGALWPKRFEAYELLPLRAADVSLAATDHQLDSEQFFALIRANNLGPLARIPTTLNFLLREFAAGTLPRDRTQLFDHGCCALAEESNPSHQAARQRGKLTGTNGFVLPAVLPLRCNSVVYRGLIRLTAGRFGRSTIDRCFAPLAFKLRARQLFQQRRV
jgi:hypothetical protein